MPIKQKLDRI